MGRRRRGGQGRAAGRKLLINARESAESRIALLEGGRLEEYYIERGSLGSTLGNVYKARVTNVEKSIGAAFVEFGHSRQGFLHVSDLCMAAVGENARQLLASLQQAREHAHDEEIVDAGTPTAAAADVADAKEAGRQATPRASADLGPGAATRPSAKAGPKAGADALEAELAAEPSPARESSVDGDGEDDGEDDGDVGQERVETQQDLDDDLDAEAPGYANGVETLVHDSEADPLDLPEPDEAVQGAEPAARASADDGPPGGSRREREGLAFARGDDLDDDEELETDGTDEVEGARLAAELGVDDGSDGDDDEDEDTEAGGQNAGSGATAAGGGPSSATATAAETEQRGQARRRGRRRGRRGGRNVPTTSRAPREMPPIQDILQKGQEIVVQVIKDGIGNKGPTLTTYLSIPGRFIVLMPGIAKRGVSRKVVENAERDRLKAIVRDLEVPDGLGFIVRTAGTGASREDLQRDLDYLLRLWEQMKTRIVEHSAPVLLYQENDLVIRTLRDLYDGEGEIIIDDRPTMEKARQFVSEIMPRCVDKVIYHDSDRPLFSHYNVENEITQLLVNRIELEAGGSLFIEQSVALVAIDVNSGRFKPSGGTGIEDTALAVNSEAAVEIARQIRLRDLGGVVVVDFIDMRAERHRKQLENIFKEALRRDRARIKVARFSPFGIIELTRQRVRSSLKRTVHQACPYCTGTGYIPSDETSALAVVRTVRDNVTRPGAVLVVTVRPEVAEAVLNQHRQALTELEQASRKVIFVRGDHRLAYEEIEVRPMVALPDDLDHRHS
jgi:ribonuclease E